MRDRFFARLPIRFRSCSQESRSARVTLLFGREEVYALCHSIPKKLPPGVYAEYKKGPKFWPLAVQKAMDAAIFDITKLTDIVFYLHHPERIGNPLKPFETKLIN